ncbi:MAG TPA: hypothetical protein VGD73_08985 [Pseudonocardia sp.]
MRTVSSPIPAPPSNSDEANPLGESRPEAAEVTGPDSGVTP